MSSSFQLQLDTTAPQIEIYAPSYTTNNDLTEIRIVANENISSIQNIYIIDKNNNKIDLTFDYNVNEFIGEIYFTIYGGQTVTLYAQVQDEVHNLSSLVSKSIQVIDTNWEQNNPKIKPVLDIQESIYSMESIESTFNLINTENTITLTAIDGVF